MRDRRTPRTVDIGELANQQLSWKQKGSMQAFKAPTEYRHLLSPSTLKALLEFEARRKR